jgi:hypothetical protein
MDAVIVLPFSAYGTDWKFLTGLERHHTPISDFLAAKFASEAPDIALSERRAEELFDQTELAIALGYVHRLLVKEPARPIGMPVGRFCWKSRGQTFEADLKRIEELSNSDAFFEAGMLGGSQAMAAPTLQKIREIQRELGRYGW